MTPQDTQPTQSDSLDEIFSDTYYGREHRAGFKARVQALYAPKPDESVEEILDNLKNMNDPIIFARAAQKLEAHYSERERRAVQETEKAFGGCKNCYGKGYATVNDRWHGHDTDTDIGSPGGYVSGGNANAMKFCTCDRGKQLAKQIASLQEPTHDK